MKIKLDENMPEILADRLRGLGHDVHTVPEESLAGKPMDLDLDWPSPAPLLPITP